MSPTLLKSKHFLFQLPWSRIPAADLSINSVSALGQRGAQIPALRGTTGRQHRAGESRTAPQSGHRLPSYCNQVSLYLQST